MRGSPRPDDNRSSLVFVVLCHRGGGSGGNWVALSGVQPLGIGGGHVSAEQLPEGSVHLVPGAGASGVGARGAGDGGGAAVMNEDRGATGAGECFGEIVRGIDLPKSSFELLHVRGRAGAVLHCPAGAAGRRGRSVHQDVVV